MPKEGVVGLVVSIGAYHGWVSRWQIPPSIVFLELLPVDPTSWQSGLFGAKVGQPPVEESTSGFIHSGPLCKKICCSIRHIGVCIIMG